MSTNIVYIEAQTAGGSWIKVAECSSHPVIIKQLFDAHMKSSTYTKFRATDPNTKALLDMAFKI